MGLQLKLDVLSHGCVVGADLAKGALPSAADRQLFSQFALLFDLFDLVLQLFGVHQHGHGAGLNCCRCQLLWTRSHRAGARQASLDGSGQSWPASEWASLWGRCGARAWGPDRRSGRDELYVTRLFLHHACRYRSDDSPPGDGCLDLTGMYAPARTGFHWGGRTLSGENFLAGDGWRFGRLFDFRGPNGFQIRNFRDSSFIIHEHLQAELFNRHLSARINPTRWGRRPDTFSVGSHLLIPDVEAGVAVGLWLSHGSLDSAHSQIDEVRRHNVLRSHPDLRSQQGFHLWQTNHLIFGLQGSVKGPGHSPLDHRGFFGQNIAVILIALLLNNSHSWPRFSCRWSELASSLGGSRWRWGWFSGQAGWWRSVSDRVFSLRVVHLLHREVHSLPGRKPAGVGPGGALHSPCRVQASLAQPFGAVRQLGGMVAVLKLDLSSRRSLRRHRAVQQLQVAGSSFPHTLGSHVCIGLRAHWSIGVGAILDQGWHFVCLQCVVPVNRLKVEHQ